jgi:hypothetical protein
LVVNAGGELALISSLLAQVKDTRVRLIDLPGQPFNKSQALNVGVHCSRGERIFMVDADILLAADTMKEIEGLRTEETFVTIRHVVESQGLRSALLSSEIVQTSEYICSDGRRSYIEFRTGSDNSRSGPGLLLLNKQDFVSVAGFNSALRDWNFEDYDFQLRLQLHLGIRRVLAGEVIHLSHIDGARAKRVESNRRNRSIAESNYRRGKFMGTYAHDVDKLEGISTKVFPLTVSA